MRTVWYVIILELIIISCISFSDINTGEKKGEQKIYVGGEETTEDAGEEMNEVFNFKEMKFNVKHCDKCHEQKQKSTSINANETELH